MQSFHHVLFKACLALGIVLAMSPSQAIAADYDFLDLLETEELLELLEAGAPACVGSKCYADGADGPKDCGCIGSQGCKKKADGTVECCDGKKPGVRGVLSNCFQCSVDNNGNCNCVAVDIEDWSAQVPGGTYGDSSNDSIDNF